MLIPFAGGKLFRAHADDPGSGGIPQDEFSLLIGRDQALGHTVEYGLQRQSLGFQGLPRAQQFFGLPGKFFGLSREPVFSLFPLGGVARNFRSAYDRTAAVLNRRDGHGNVNDLAVLPYAEGFEMLYALAAPDARQNVGFFMPALGRNKHLHRFAQTSDAE